MVNSASYMSSVSVTIRLVCLVALSWSAQANPDAKRLYDDLLSHYNRLIRPVSNNSQVVTVRLGLHLTQLIDLDLKNQILTTNVWVEHEWMDAKLIWDPEEYGGVRELMVPSDHIWLPDIVLYNNADGEYVVTTMTKAILYHDGNVKWNPPAIFKSYCEIDVRYFPFDTQTCFMKFGSWSYSGLQMDLKHIHSSENLVEIGMNLKDYYPSGEWDILDVPAERHARFYECCPNEFYADIFFNITLRRKTLFYTVNLIIPSVALSCLSILTFYLPADSGEKVALCITTLLSQTMFFLLMSEIIPSTSLAVPLLGRYLLFTMCLVGLSVLITIVILNVRYRKPSTHKMPPWVRRFFIQKLPKLLFMRVPAGASAASSSSAAAAAAAAAPPPPPPHKSAAQAFHGTSEQAIKSRSGMPGIPSFNQTNNASRLASASGSPFRTPSSSVRRRSRISSPVHYGSQLLCEVINYNASRRQNEPSAAELIRLPSPPPTPSSSPMAPNATLPPPPTPLMSFVPSPVDAAVAASASASASARRGSSGSEASVHIQHAPGCAVQRAASWASIDGYDAPLVRRRNTNVVKRYPVELQKAIRDIQFIQNHMKRADQYDEEENDWGFIAMVLDRFFLWVFTLASLFGTISILFSAPALYDDSKPINLKYLGELGFY